MVCIDAVGWKMKKTELDITPEQLARFKVSFAFAACPPKCKVMFSQTASLQPARALHSLTLSSFQKILLSIVQLCFLPSSRQPMASPFRKLPTPWG